MNGLEDPRDFEKDKEATAVGPYSKIKAQHDSLELLYGDEDISFAGLLLEPNLFLFNFTFGDVKEAAGEGCRFFDSDPGVIRYFSVH